MYFNTTHTHSKCIKNVTCTSYHKWNSHNYALYPTNFENNQLKTVPKTSHLSSNTDFLKSVNNTTTTFLLRNQTSRSTNFVNASTGAHTTIKLTLVCPETSRPYSICALIDNGNNTTYIAKSIFKRLGLWPISFTHLPIEVFANEEPVYINTTQTSAIFTNVENFNLTVQLNALPKIPRTFDYKLLCIQYPEHSASFCSTSWTWNDWIAELLLRRVYTYSTIQLLSFDFIVLGRMTKIKRDNRRTSHVHNYATMCPKTSRFLCFFPLYTFSSVLCKNVRRRWRSCSFCCYYSYFKCNECSSAEE